MNNYQKISKIAKRAFGIALRSGLRLSIIDTIMDLDCCHKKTPLVLDKLIKADGFNLLHDVLGISRHLNRETGELENCFLPRCAR